MISCILVRIAWALKNLYSGFKHKKSIFIVAEIHMITDNCMAYTYIEMAYFGNHLSVIVETNFIYTSCNLGDDLLR